MIKRKGDLHELIQSLSSSEKRHFRLFSGLFRKEKTDYQFLYEAIESQKFYNEKEIVQLFKSKPFVRSLDIKKHYLYILILKSLSNFHSKDFEEELTLAQVDLLISKGLYRQAYTLLEREKLQAENAEKIQELISYLEKEFSLSRFFATRKREEILDDLIRFSSRFNLQLQFRKLHMTYREGIDQYMFIRNTDQKRKYDEIMQHPLMRTSILPDDFRSAYIFCILKFWSSGTKGDWNMSLKFARESFELLNDKKNKLQNFFQEYMFVFNNLLVSAIKSSRYDYYEKYLNDLKKLMPKIKSPHEKAQVHFVVNVMDLIYLNNSAKWEEAPKVISTALHFIENEIRHIDELRTKSFYFNLAKVYIGISDYKNAYRWLNKIISSESKNEANDFHAFSRIIFCLCCFERGDLDLMNYTLKSTKRFMKDRKIIFEFEKRFFRFLEKETHELQSMNLLSRKEKYKQLKKDLNEIFKNPMERNVLNYFWFDRWVETKLL